MLVREGSKGRLEELRNRWGVGFEDRVVAIIGDLSQPRLGVSDRGSRRLQGEVDHLFHLAAIYDMTADAESQQIANIEGTRHMVEFANAVEAGRVHMVSSIAAAGLYKGLWLEDMFDEAQDLDTHPYFRTKHDSEGIVRTDCERPWRVYRPGIVVGHSETGEMDKVDGPYYFFKLIQRLRGALPQWMPTIGIEGKEINLVPVDFVAKALDHIAHLDDERWDGKAFSLTDPNPKTAGQVINLFARAGHAPQMGMRLDPKMFGMIPPQVRSGLLMLPPVKRIRNTVLGDLGIPESVLTYVNYPTSFDNRNARRGARGQRHRRAATRGVRGQALGLLGAEPGSRPVQGPLAGGRGRRQGRDDHRRLVGDRQVGGAQGRARRAAPCCSSPGRPRSSRRRATRSRPQAARRTSTGATSRTSRTSSGWPTRSSPSTAASTSWSTTPGRSIRRSVALSYDRFHDYERTMQLNYFGALKLIMKLLPVMREQRFGHIVNISSIGVQTNTPRFSAYVASKAALDAFSRCIGSEVIDDNVHITTIHMPLVRTPMIAPTKMYDAFPTISSEEAAEMITDAIIRRPKKVATKLGHLRRGPLLAGAEGVGRDPPPGLQALPGLEGCEGRRRQGRQGRGRLDRGRGVRVPDARRALVEVAGERRDDERDR